MRADKRWSLPAQKNWQAKAEYLRAKSLQDIAEQNLKREEELFSKKIAPMKDVLTARAAHDTALLNSSCLREKFRLLIPAAELRA